ncbi:MAG: hypothetical protein WB696_12865, partial [Chthoniobacterales bacterium]
ITVLAGILLLWMVPAFAGTLEKAPVNVQPSAETNPPWEITVEGPGWIAGLNGTIGTHGVTTDVDISFSDILKKTNFIASLGAEIRRGRFGAYGGFLYLDAQTSASGSGLVNKVDLGLQESLGEFGLSYRILQAPQGWCDILAGFRFTYIGNQMGLQANQANINMASTALVNGLAQQITTPGSNLNTLLQQTIQSRLGALADRNPGLPVPPLAGREPGLILNFIRGVIQTRRPELAAAIQSGVQARVNLVKAALSSEIATGLTSRLSQKFSLYQDWFDPFIGVRGRYNFYKPFYLTAEGDVGGFGIGSEVTCQAYGGIGCQLTRNIFSEVGYRLLYTDYDTTSLVYQVVMHGAQITVGLTF